MTQPPIKNAAAAGPLRAVRVELAEANEFVRLHDGKVLAGSTDKQRAETTAEVLGPGYVVRERKAQFIGIEKDPTYAEVARERLEAESRGLTLRDARAGQLSLLGDNP